MKQAKKFGIVGGDKRNLLLSEILDKDKNITKICGFESIDLESNAKKIYEKLESTISGSNYVILPTVPTKDLKTIFAPFSSTNILINDELVNLLKNKTIFCGKKELLYKSNAKFKSLKIIDYSSREDFMILNALPTAQSAIYIALREYNKILLKSNCLISGFGRIGKFLAKLLRSFGCNITISARKSADLCWIESLEYESINVNRLEDISKYDLIFNTVPSMIFDKTLLSTCKKETIIIDLASKPGGTDFEYANKNGIKAIHALGLPGEITPYSAAKIIKKSIYNAIEEEGL